MRLAVVTGFQSWAEELPGLLGGDIVLLRPDDPPERAADVDAVIGGPNPDRFRALLAGLPSLRWFHTLSAGVEQMMLPELLERPELVLTNNSGAYDVSIAEHVVATIFAAAKHLPTSFAAQQRREWHGDPRNTDVRGATLVIVGMGSIGGELGAVARALGMRVIGIRRRAAEGALGPDRLADVAGEADYLAVCAPLTPETRGMVSADVIGRLKPTAWVINISRGAIIDEAALLAACREARIGGAAIDAWWKEPLPPDSEWWGLPNVIVTPHTSFSSPSVRERSVALIAENVRRFAAGEPLLNRVDPRLGY